jgi:hypothetical protein
MSRKAGGPLLLEELKVPVAEAGNRLMRWTYATLMQLPNRVIRRVCAAALL